MVDQKCSARKHIFVCILNWHKSRGKNLNCIQTFKTGPIFFWSHLPPIQMHSKHKAQRCKIPFQLTAPVLHPSTFSVTFQPNAARCVFLRHNDRQTKTFSSKTSCKFPSNSSAALQAVLPGGGFAGRQEGKSAAGECEERAEPSAAGYGAGKHNIGHHRKQQVAAVAAHG